LDKLPLTRVSKMNYTLDIRLNKTEL
jgi:hypothetical protein